LEKVLRLHPPVPQFLMKKMSLAA